MFEDAQRAAEHLVSGLSKDERWALLEDHIEDELVHQEEELRRALQLHALGQVVCPRVTQRQWGDVLNGKSNLKHWIHLRRLEHATGI